MQKRLTNMLRTKTLIFASAIALALLPGFGVAQEAPKTSYYESIAYGWQIDTFDSVIEVRPDSSIRVTETIEAQFNPVASKHGIFREIPVIYRDDFGNRVKIKLDVESVTQNGEPANYEESKNFDSKNIKIGHGNIEIEGPVVYEIVYTVERAMLYFDDFDEIYWNATGTDWEVPIFNATAVVILPDGVEAINTACYTGDFGSTNQDCGIASEDNLSAFAANDFLTVAVSFPKGIVAEPSFFDRVLFFLTDNWVALFPILIIFGLFVFWAVFGRDPSMKSIVAEFEPPEGIKAVYAGFIVRNNFASQFNAAMIVQMAVEGYLEINVEPGKTVLGIKSRKISLKKLKPGTDLDTVHKLLFNAIFKSGDQVSIAKIRKNVGQSNMMTRVIAQVKKKMKEDEIYTRSSFAFRALIGVAVSAPLFWLSFMLGTFFGPFTGVMFFIAGLISAVFAWLMPKRTRKGTELARKILGFKQFMHTAERYRSKWHEEQNMFTDYLPYAIAFNDVKEWAKTFKDLDYKNPSWYVSSVAHVSALDFATDLTSATSSIRTAMSYRSSGGSSGSSGGGFSGGGFGGGGGGSW